MSRSRTAPRSLASGAVFAALLGLLYFFSSGLHVGRVLLAGALFASGTYFLARRRQYRRS